MDMNTFFCSSRLRRQRGVGTLLAVVLLYAAMAIIVVFTNRSLIFEQKTSANQYRATMALETAASWVTTARQSVPASTAAITATSCPWARLSRLMGLRRSSGLVGSDYMCIKYPVGYQPS